MLKAHKINRQVHRWGSIIFALPLLVIVISGIVLQLKKELAWVQPPTQRGEAKEPTLHFEQILAIARKVPESSITSWADIDRLDVRPSKGLLKIRAKNRWEIQLDSRTGAILQVAIRRSDLIESLHDGSFFHHHFKLWVFLPTAIMLAVLLGTGLYLFVLPYIHRSRKRRRITSNKQEQRNARTFGV